MLYIFDNNQAIIDIFDLNSIYLDALFNIDTHCFNGKLDTFH